MASPKMATFFKFFGVNLKNSVPAMQVPLATPVTTAKILQQVVLVASRMDVEDAPMDMEGVLQDVPSTAIQEGM